eukprot:3941119-Prymnesium_polylepis.2
MPWGTNASGPYEPHCWPISMAGYVSGAAAGECRVVWRCAVACAAEECVRMLWPWCCLGCLNILSTWSARTFYEAGTRALASSLRKHDAGRRPLGAHGTGEHP